MSLITGKYLGDNVVQESPTGAINGSNTSFALSVSPNYSGSVFIYKNGLIQRLTTDFTVSGVTITMIVAPASGSSLYAVYIKE